MSDFVRTLNTQDTVVTVNNTSRIAGGEEADIVSIDTVITLNTPEAQEIILVLPEQEGQQAAYIRPLLEQDKKPFEPADADQVPSEIVELLKQVGKIRDKLQATKITIKPGDQELKFFLQKKIVPGPDGIFSLQFQAPYSNFQVNGQSEISVIIILPRGAQYLSAKAIDPATGEDVTNKMQEQTTRGNRLILSWLLPRDPIFTVNYKYN